MEEGNIVSVFSNVDDQIIEGDAMGDDEEEEDDNENMQCCEYCQNMIHLRGWDKNNNITIIEREYQ